VVERFKSRADPRVIRMKELTAMIGQSEWTIRRWIAAGEFPNGIRLGVRNVGWLVDDIRDWLKSRKGNV
jgi:prophage regulatory protein